MKIIKKNPLLFILGLMIILGICFFLAINPGSAKGFLRTTWNNNPDKANAHPTSIVTITLGKRIWFKSWVFWNEC